MGLSQFFKSDSPETPGLDSLTAEQRQSIAADIFAIFSCVRGWGQFVQSEEHGQALGSEFQTFGRTLVQKVIKAAMVGDDVFANVLQGDFTGLDWVPPAILDILKQVKARLDSINETRTPTE